MNTPPRYTDTYLYKRVLGFAKPYRAHVAAYLGISLLATPLALLAPVPLKVAVDSVLGDQPPPDFVQHLLPATSLESTSALLVFAVGMLVVVAGLSQLQKVATSMMYTFTGESLSRDFRSMLFHHVQRLPLLFHDTTQTTDSTYRVLWDAAAIRHIILDGVTPYVTAGFTLIAMIVVIFQIDFVLAMVALAVTPILFWLTWCSRNRLRDRWREVKRLESEALSIVQEVLSAIRVVKVFGNENREQSRFERRTNAGVRSRIRASIAADTYNVLITMTTVLGTSIVLFVGVQHVQAGTLTLGSLLLVMAYLSELYGPLKTISKNVGTLQAHLAGAERAISLIDQEPDVPERHNAIPLQRAAGALSFKSVSFSYTDDVHVLHDVSFDIAAGTRVGIAGRSGTGKTTLVSLLPRLYDPSQGSILLDGIDIRNYRVADLREQFSIVLQEPVLFSSTLAANIAYARPGASQEEIIDAARAANAHQFIRQLPDGYETHVGERGVRLSGGERQRIALARAFLKDAPILILDEPTSSVDIGTEGEIIEAFDTLMADRTTFIIAHRQETLAHCDQLLTVEHGRVTPSIPPTHTPKQQTVTAHG